MKIKAIRLKEVGRFSAPIALEGLSGGLDVLAGPNEFGKSTILKAVKAVLFDAHRSKHRKLEVLRPYSGGAPLIEVDFDLDGTPWRIRKQFLSSPSAELRNMQSGNVTRGVDAETRLAELLGGGSHFALLCVDQGSPLAAMTPLETGGKALRGAVENEVESIAEGNAARFVAERVKTALAALVTSHNPPRPSGIFKTALDERDRLQRDREEAAGRLVAAQERLDRLEALRARLGQLADTDAVRARETTAAEARRAFEEARDARDKCKAAEQIVASCEQHAAALKSALATFDHRASELAKIESAAAQVGPLLAEAETRAAAGSARVGERRQARDAIKTALTALEHARRALDVSERLERARAAQAERVALSEALAANTAVDKIVDAARREAASIGELQARLSAAAPRVSLNYLPGGAGRIKVDGRPLADGETFSPTRAVTLDIEGIGTITIAPGQSSDVAEDEADLAARREQFTALLARAGASSLDDAERLLAARRDIEAQLAEAAAQLKASAPEGIERLQRMHTDLTAQAASLGAPLVVSEDDVEARAEELGRALAPAEEAFDEAVRLERAASDELVGLRTRIAGNAQQIEQLIAELGPPAVRIRARAEKLATANEAQSTLNAAVRDGTAWREKAPEDARFAVLKLAAEAAESACRQANDELAGLRRTEAGLEGELRSDRADDVAARLAELLDASAVAAARCDELQEEAAALQLLARELDIAATRTRDRFAKPVIERLA
ncbi:MAG: AAA family ATPase, partial [Hyphomicrobium sp.]